MKTLLAAATAAICLFAAPAISSAAVTPGGVTVPVTFHPTGKNGPTTPGTLTIKQFQNINGSLLAMGTVSYNNPLASVAVPVLSVNSTPKQASSTSSTAAADPAACPIASHAQSG